MAVIDPFVIFGNKIKNIFAVCMENMRAVPLNSYAVSVNFVIHIAGNMVPALQNQDFFITFGKFPCNNAPAKPGPCNNTINFGNISHFLWKKVKNSATNHRTELPGFLRIAHFGIGKMHLKKPRRRRNRLAEFTPFPLGICRQTAGVFEFWVS
jgi:hypothetical protein